MITSLVGYSGFVGSNLMESHVFDYLYNSRNIEEAFGSEPDVLVYSAVPAEMFIANSNPAKDLDLINNAIHNIELINPKRVVLISTVAVYDDITCGDEDTNVKIENCTPYGRNRFILEEWVANNYNNSLIVRLPAIYGKNLKKNFIYDYINVIPKLLKEEKFKELKNKDKRILQYYTKRDESFYVCKTLSGTEKKTLINIFNSIGFSALNFTDSRNVYQFYNLSNLWNDICVALLNDVRKINLVTEPISVNELYFYLENRNFKNEVVTKPLIYNLKTIHYKLYNGNGGYISSKKEVLQDLKKYILECKNETFNF